VTRLRMLSVDELAAELPRNQAQRVFDAMREPTAPKIQ
jgi:hypothetical protein